MLALRWIDWLPRLIHLVLGTKLLSRRGTAEISILLRKPACRLFRATSLWAIDRRQISLRSKNGIESNGKIRVFRLGGFKRREQHPGGNGGVGARFHQNE